MKKPSSVRFRRMKPGEADAVAQLMREVIARLSYYNVRARRAEIAKYAGPHLIEMQTTDPASVLIATANGTPVGFCINESQDGVTWLSWLGVARQVRKQRIATGLLNLLGKEARRRKHCKIWCDCRTSNVPVRKLFAESGFDCLCTVRKHWYGQDFILWEKWL